MWTFVETRSTDLADEMPAHSELPVLICHLDPVLAWSSGVPKPCLIVHDEADILPERFSRMYADCLQKEPAKGYATAAALNHGDIVSKVSWSQDGARIQGSGSMPCEINQCPPVFSGRPQ